MKNYIDIDLKFTKHPVTGDVAKKVGVRAVLQSVRNIVMTTMGEWQTMPNMGAGMYRQLGENTTPTIQVDIQNKIEDAIVQYETRAELEDVSVVLMDDLHTLKVSITFYVINTPDPVTDIIYLQRTN